MDRAPGVVTPPVPRLCGLEQRKLCSWRYRLCEPAADLTLNHEVFMSNSNHEDRLGRFLGTTEHAPFIGGEIMSEREAFERLLALGVGQMTFIGDSLGVHERGHDLSGFGLPPTAVVVIEALPEFCSTCRELLDHIEQASAVTLDNGRYHYRVDRVLSRFDESECGKARYPSADELEEAGVDTVALALAVNAGLTPATLGKAYHAGLDLRAFADAVAQGLNVQAFVKAFNGRALSVSEFADTLASMEISKVNDCLEMIAETVEEHQAFPDVADRVLHRLGDC